MKSIKLLKTAAARGSAKAHYHLAKMYQYKQFDKALQHLHQAAPSYHRAAFWLGEHYGCNKQPEQAIQWLKKAVELGHDEAADLLEEVEEYGDISDCII